MVFMLIAALFVFNPSEWHPHVVVGGWCAFRVSKNRPRCPVCAGQMKKNGLLEKQNFDHAHKLVHYSRFHIISEP